MKFLLRVVIVSSCSQSVITIMQCKFAPFLQGNTIIAALVSILDFPSFQRQQGLKFVSSIQIIVIPLARALNNVS